MATKTPAQQLAGFLARFSPEVARAARAALRKMRARLPGAVELVYDNYNALAIGFGPNERATDAVFSIAVLPRRPSLVFIYGAGLPDPEGLLSGGGNQVRHIQILDPTASVLDTPAVRALMRAALADAQPKIDSRARRRLVIKSVSKKQRPRRVRLSQS
jgi:hypothetical protein